MLFISRRVGFDSYGVFDTDDGTEEIISHKDLEDAVRKTRVKIKGVYNVHGHYNVMPWQSSETLQNWQMKMAMVNRVNMLMWGNMITSISWDKNGTINNPVIVLSEYGKVCADWLFGSVEYAAFKQMITIVMTDDIVIRDLTFMPNKPLIPLGSRGTGVVVDVSRMQNLRKVADVYWQLLIRRFGTRDDPVDYVMKDSIIDSWERRTRMSNMVQKFVDDAFSDTTRCLMDYELLKRLMLEEFSRWY